MWRVLQAAASLKVMGWDPGQRPKWEIHQECIPLLSSPLFFLALSVFGRTAVAITLLYISSFNLTNDRRAPGLSDRFPGLRCEDGEYHCQSTRTWRLTASSKLPHMHRERAILLFSSRTLYVSACEFSLVLCFLGECLGELQYLCSCIAEPCQAWIRCNRAWASKTGCMLLCKPHVCLSCYCSTLTGGVFKVSISNVQLHMRCIQITKKLQPHISFLISSGISVRR